MNARLIWSLAGLCAVMAIVLLVYGTHALTIIQRIAFKVF